MANAPIVECDVASDSSIACAAEQVLEASGGNLAGLAHCIAWAPADAMKGGILATSREAFAAAHDVSSSSLLALPRALLPGLEAGGGGAVQTLTYLGATRVSIPPPPSPREQACGTTSLCIASLPQSLCPLQASSAYSVMGPAKASLEGVVRQLAAAVGPAGVTVNAVSAPPCQTVAARGIRDFTTLAQEAEARKLVAQDSPASDVGALCAYLSSPAGRGITGQVLHVDGGFSSRL